MLKTKELRDAHVVINPIYSDEFNYLKQINITINGQQFTLTKGLGEKMIREIADADSLLPFGKEFISIPLSVYEILEEDSQLLRNLEVVGVDNWEGYSMACSMIEENKE